jgi:hypothetical protein
MKVPSAAALERELEVVKRAGTPALVVGGGWSPSFEAVCDAVADRLSGRRLVIRSPHHFPQLVSDEFNQTLDAFMRERS